VKQPRTPLFRFKVEDFFTARPERQLGNDVSPETMKGRRPTDLSVLVAVTRKVDIRLPGKGDSNSHGTRPVYSNHHDD